MVKVKDSMAFPITHANAAGIDSIFVLGGIHAKELGLKPTGCGGDEGIVILDNDNDQETGGRYITKKELTIRLQSLFDSKGIWPTHVVPSLSLEST